MKDGYVSPCVQEMMVASEVVQERNLGSGESEYTRENLVSSCLLCTVHIQFFQLCHDNHKY